MTFAFLGGPLHRLGRRFGLVRGTNTVRLGLVLGPGLWVVILVLGVLGGVAERAFSLSVIGAHARLLVVIPLFFVCESWVAPRMAAFVRRLTEDGIVPATDATALDANVSQMNRWNDAWWTDMFCIVVAILVSATGVRMQYGSSAAVDATRTAWAATIYYRGALVLFQFLWLRWMVRLTLWAWFLWRVSRLNLHLVPSHPDTVGGLESLSEVHERFTPLVAAISVLQCAAVAEDLSTGVVILRSVYPSLAFLLLVDAVTILGPMFVFTDKLWASRTRGMDDYMGFAGRYVTAFERKWLAREGVPPDEPMLGTPDLQSLADLGNSVEVVRNMRWVPIGRRLLGQIAVAALVPLMPLLLFQYPLAELAQRFFGRLLGL